MCFRYISAYISYISWDLLIKQIIPSLQNLHSISNHRNHPLKHCYASHRNTTLTGTCSRSLHLTNWIQFASNHNCQVGECVFWVKKDTSIILFGSMTMNRQYVLYIYIYALTQHKKHTLEKNRQSFLIIKRETNTGIHWIVMAIVLQPLPQEASLSSRIGSTSKRFSSVSKMNCSSSSSAGNPKKPGNQVVTLRMAYRS